MGTDFAGRTALITGAGRGIGRAVAVGLADASAGLILVARSAVELAQTQAIVFGRGASAGQVRIVPADLADQQQRDQAAAVALEAGGVDILVNNAATVEPLGPTAAVPVAALRRRLPGYATATPDTLQRRFLNTGGIIENDRRQTTIRLARRTYSPVLRQASLPETITVPWWGGQTLRYQYD